MRLVLSQIMESKNEHLRQFMLACFREGKNAAQTHKMICAMYGCIAISDWTVGQWFRRFRHGNVNCVDLPRSGRPTTVDDDQIRTLIENNPCYTIREMADVLRISKSTVLNHLHKLGYVNRRDVWVPDDSTNEGKLSVDSVYRKKVESVVPHDPKSEGKLLVNSVCNKKVESVV